RSTVGLKALGQGVLTRRWLGSPPNHRGEVLVLLGARRASPLERGRKPPRGIRWPGAPDARSRRAREGAYSQYATERAQKATPQMGCMGAEAPGRLFGRAPKRTGWRSYLSGRIEDHHGAAQAAPARVGGRRRPA